MRAVEVALRKELAVTHVRIARAELALQRAQQPSEMLAVASAIDLASLLLARRPLGKWGEYLRLCLRVARMVLGLRKMI